MRTPEEFLCTDGRCPICRWPLAPRMEDGCIPGNCSYRPDDPSEQRVVKRRRDEYAKILADLREFRAEVLAECTDAEAIEIAEWMAAKELEFGHVPNMRAIVNKAFAIRRGKAGV